MILMNDMYCDVLLYRQDLLALYNSCTYYPSTKKNKINTGSFTFSAACFGIFAIIFFFCILVIVISYVNCFATVYFLYNVSLERTGLKIYTN